MASVVVSVFFLFSHLLLLHSAEEEMTYTQKCPPFTCGNLETMGFPFTNKTKPECGLFTVDCQNGRSTIQPVDGGRSYVVISVSESNTLHIIDSELLERLKSNSCEAFTNLSLPRSSFSSFELLPNQTFFKCNHTLSVSPPPSFKTMPCNHSDIYYSISDHSFPSSFSGCSIIQLPKNLGEDPGSPRDENNPFSLVTHVMDVVVRVSDKCYKCFYKGGQCKANSEGRFYCDGAEKETHRLTAVQVAIVIGASSLGVGILLVIICYFRRKFSSSSIIYDWRKKSLSQQTVQAFLRNHGPFTIKRYSYSNIKTMTNSFKDKLGEGGYGSVYKGMLRDGCLVAVKILKQSKENGEEFINEVTSISRTSHVNIVSLIGFCFEGPKRALIYEFMPNGSLEKFIHLSKDKFQLEWETLYKIALGIARGLEYLHRGCNTRILHFDIKPHNILLDENFCPKISDFGLAKICSREESIVSMLVARGTAGYIAPEVFCRNFGGVSHKSDVYSYGMMVFEMIEGRKNVEVDDDCVSEIFFPHLVYKHLEEDEKLGLQGLKNEMDHESARKMIIVSLWCIQTDPSNRPSMSRVVNMLEGLEPLQVPPIPFLCSPSRSQESSSTTMGSLQYGSKIF